MNLADQLQELRDNILRDKSDLIAGDADELWSDETLLRYIKDAERRFARRTLMLRDGTTTAVTQITLTSGTKTYALHESVLGVLSARYDVDEYDLKRSGHALAVAIRPPEFLSFDPASPYTISPGKPLAFYTDETLVHGGQNRITLTVYPVPAADQTGKKIYMRVVRLPMTSYTQEDLELGNESEIPDDYQLDVLEWAAYRALRGFDNDAGAPTKAESHKQAFDEAITRASLEMKRKVMNSTGLRFGSNGFTWER